MVFEFDKGLTKQEQATLFNKNKKTKNKLKDSYTTSDNIDYLYR